MTEELLTAWRSADAHTKLVDLSTEARDEAETEARLAHDRYRDRIESLDGAARELGSRRATDDACSRAPETARTPARRPAFGTIRSDD